jgi:hypothetical protein
MLSARLIQRIENNWESILRSLIHDVHRDGRLPTYQALNDAELRARAEDLVRNLGFWVASGNEAEIAHRYQALGARRRAQGFPLSELIAKLQLLEHHLVEQVQWENSAATALDVYQELDLVRAIHRYFRQVTYSVARGYEERHAPAETRSGEALTLA